VDGLHPGPEGGLEGLRVQSVEDTLEGVMGRDAVGQRQKALQPNASLAAKGFNLLPVLRTGDDRTRSDHDDILQPMELAMSPSWVL
jgi:hypothetical protein